MTFLCFSLFVSHSHPRVSQLSLILSSLHPFLSQPLSLSGRQKAFKDTSQYVVGELSALESEQRHIDARAARVEKRLRYLMDTGTPSPITLEKLFWQIEHTHTHTGRLCVCLREGESLKASAPPSQLNVARRSAGWI